jgi:hypothetical protein
MSIELSYKKSKPKIKLPSEGKESQSKGGVVYLIEAGELALIYVLWGFNNSLSPNKMIFDITGVLKINQS